MIAIALPPLGLVGNRIVVRLKAAGYSKMARSANARASSQLSYFLLKIPCSSCLCQGRFEKPGVIKGFCAHLAPLGRELVQMARD